MPATQELRTMGPYIPLHDTLSVPDLRYTWPSEVNHNMFRADGRPVTNDTIIVYVLGPTASGKSELALELAELAEQLGGAIIALDTRTLYEGMDIGTASPPFEDEFRAPHGLVDVVPYGIGTPVARSVLEKAVKKGIAQAVEGARLPVVTGGAVYLAETLLYNNKLERGISGEEYMNLTNHYTVPELIEYCQTEGLGLPFESDDRERLISHILARRNRRRENLAIPTGTLVLGVERGQEDLAERIRTRTRAMMDQGLEEEVLRLLRQTGGFATPLLNSTIGYREFREYIRGECSIEEVEQKIVASTIRFADWQQRELRDKIPDIKWIRTAEEAADAFQIHIAKVWKARSLAKLAIGHTRPAAIRWMKNFGFDDMIPFDTVDNAAPVS